MLLDDAFLLCLRHSLDASAGPSGMLSTRYFLRGSQRNDLATMATMSLTLVS